MSRQLVVGSKCHATPLSTLLPRSLVALMQDPSTMLRFQNVEILGFLTKMDTGLQWGFKLQFGVLSN